MSGNKTNWFWSCKLHQPKTLKRHRTFDTAARRVGDYGVVYSEADQRVRQVYWLSNGTIRGYDIEREAPHCELGDFDMLHLLREREII